MSRLGGCFSCSSCGDFVASPPEFVVSSSNCGSDFLPKIHANLGVACLCLFHLKWRRNNEEFPCSMLFFLLLFFSTDTYQSTWAYGKQEMETEMETPTGDYWTYPKYPF